MPGGLKDGRIVIVGASLAGLRAAEALCEEGFSGSLTVVGDEPHPPRPAPRSRTAPAPPYAVTPQPSFLRLDAPEHHRLRNSAMRPFGPPHSPGRVDSMRGEIVQLTKELAEVFQEGKQIEVVDDFAYPLPVTVICRLLGIPDKDEQLFQEWTDTLVASADIGPEGDTAERDQAAGQAQQEMGQYLVQLAEQRRGRPTGDMLSDLVNEPDPAVLLSEEDLAVNTILLFIAGHETTVNLIANGVLTLLRRPDQLDRLREDPGLLPRAVEELLRYEPPVHMRERLLLVDIDVAGTTIPGGTSVILALASGSRDPMRFGEPQAGSRTSGQNAMLRGPRHLPIRL